MMANRDPLFEQAAEACIAEGKGSTSVLQRKLRIGYGRASELITQLEQAGVLGPPNGSNPRDVLVKSLAAPWPAPDLPPPVGGDLREVVERIPSPFKAPAIQPARSMMDRMRGIPRPEFLEDAVACLLRDRPPTRIAADEVQSIVSDLGLSPDQARKELGGLWGRARARLLGDGVPAIAVLGYLQALARAWGLGPEYPESSREQLLYAAHRKVLRTAMQGPELTSADRSAIARSVAALGLSESEAQKLAAEAAREAVAPEIQRILSAGRATDAEAVALFKRVAALGGELPANTHRQIVLCVFAGRLDRGELPNSKVTDITLPGDEQVHFGGSCLWLEHRREKGEERLTLIDRGALLITNKRLLFNGEKKASTVKYTTLLGVNYADSPTGGKLLVLRRDNGRSLGCGTGVASKCAAGGSTSSSATSRATSR